MTARVRSILVMSASLVLLCALAGVGHLAGLRINLTPSYPLGLWRIEPLGRGVSVGDRIFICPPPDPTFELARERGYLRHGLCPGWFSPLIKTVVAVAGQHVVIDPDIAVDGVHLPHSSLRPTDGQGRALTPAEGGIVPPGQLFLFSEFAGSYDSRYFGPIPAAGVLGLARPLLVFAH
ncbi:conjugative transfer signal peptidase TraF [Mesorhizobium sp. B2-5-13]|uniref:conjugative transfer signal peptidase TraF n=1 Tax=unclassified Mesorhizobium TaxID=325217 RepID=UPI001126EEFC|nr:MULTISPECIES: conjugative transfer signal peptidase TraF [unclassified Mesorhizobium]TPJ81910.1 conjugative transfer signal peptidase TraF [Mesorhizobium sp. B2-5-13]TPK45847.1 conjugative transfer signal peptidase TraF [Mesorhizobium sp. B2-5-5]